ncbi:hypothetical protein WA158_000288 [Blastocystis sp. Blastoise]
MKVPALPYMFKRLEQLQSTNPPFHEKIVHSLDIIKKAIRIYGPEKLSISYNGGKESDVILHLLRIALVSYNQPETFDIENLKDAKINSMYFESDDDFEEITQHVISVQENLQMNMIVKNTSFQKGIQDILDNTSVEAILLGNRSTDPYSKSLTSFSPSSPGWPTFMRILPILDWTYGEVWLFIDIFNIPYCQLYNLGYSSIGKKGNTIPNPLLQTSTGYAHANTLKEWDNERLSRQ